MSELAPAPAPTVVEVEKVCCLRCFGDPHLRKHFRRDGVRGTCDYCESRRARCLPVSRMGAIVRRGLEQAYTDPENEQFGRDSEEGRWVLDGGSQRLAEVLQDHAFHERLRDSEAAQILAEDLLDATADRWSQRHGMPELFGSARNEVAVRSAVFGRQNTGVDQAWDAFRSKILHNTRFFDAGERKSSRARLLQPVAALCRRSVKRIRPGTLIWRARAVPMSDSGSQDPVLLAEQVGPAPLVFARRGNRMSPPGISYLYAAEDVETCAAEIPVPADGKLWLGAFEASRALRVVDLTGHDVRLQSIFNPGYRHRERWDWEILQDFAREIAKHVEPTDAPVDYVPTQVLAEFLRTRGYDGIRYRSAQRKRGVNLVLFLGPRHLERALQWDDPRFDPAPGAVHAFDPALRLVRFQERRGADVVVDREVPPAPPQPPQAESPASAAPEF